MCTEIDVVLEELELYTKHVLIQSDVLGQTLSKHDIAQVVFVNGILSLYHKFLFCLK